MCHMLPLLYFHTLVISCTVLLYFLLNFNVSETSVFVNKNTLFILFY